MKSRKNPYSKEIKYTDEPIGDVNIIPDFLPSPAELTAKPKRDIYAEIVEGFDALEKQREGKIILQTFNVESKPVPKSSRESAWSSCFQTWCRGWKQFNLLYL